MMPLAEFRSTGDRDANCGSIQVEGLEQACTVIQY